MATHLPESLLAELRAHFHKEFLAELHTKTLAEILALSGQGAKNARSDADGVGNGRRKPGRPKNTASAAPAAATKKTGKRGRRTADDMQRVAAKVVALLNDHPDGLRSEDIQKTLGIDKKELVGPIAQSLEAGSIRKTGQKRATTYFLADGGGSGGVGNKAAKQKAGK